MFYVGLDLGQKRDHSALVVVERIDKRYAYQGSVFEGIHVRYVERLPLGLPYPEIVDHVRRTVQSQDLRGQCSLVVDATGVGGPVVDMLRAARLGCELTAVTITGGEQPGRDSVPKRDLISGVLVLLEQEELKIGQITDRERLVEELTLMRTTFGHGGRVAMGAEGHGEHDDLVIALALACWKAKDTRKIGYQSNRLF